MTQTNTTTGDQGQEPDANGDPSGQEPTGDQQGQAPAGKLSHDDALAALEATRKSEAATRTKLREAEERIAASEREKLSETDKAKADAESAAKRADEAEARALRAEVRVDVMQKAPGLGFKTPGLLDRLLDFDKITVESDGTLKGVDEQLAAIKKDYPELLKDSGGGDGGEGQGGAKATGMNDSMRQMLGR